MKQQQQDEDAALREWLSTMRGKVDRYKRKKKTVIRVRGDHCVGKTYSANLQVMLNGWGKRQ